jgi:hypothetical protein
MILQCIAFQSEQGQAALGVAGLRGTAELRSKAQAIQRSLHPPVHPVSAPVEQNLPRLCLPGSPPCRLPGIIHTIQLIKKLHPLAQRVWPEHAARPSVLWMIKQHLRVLHWH